MRIRIKEIKSKPQFDLSSLKVGSKYKINDMEDTFILIHISSILPEEKYVFKAIEGQTIGNFTYASSEEYMHYLVKTGNIKRVG